MKQLAHVFAAAVLLFAGALAVIIGTHIDQSTLMVLCGVFIGVVVVTPTTVMIVMLSMRDRRSQRQIPPHQDVPPAFPPQPYWVLSPTAPPPVQRQRLSFPTSEAQWTLPPRQRVRIIGQASDTEDDR